MRNMNKKYREVLNDYDIESVEIHNYDLFAKLKDKIKTNKTKKLNKEQETKMARKSKTDAILEVVLNLKEEFNGFKNEFNEFKTEVKSEIQEIKNDLNNFKIEVKEEFSKVNSRLDKLENDVNVLKSEAIKHGWNV